MRFKYSRNDRCAVKSTTSHVPQRHGDVNHGNHFHNVSRHLVFPGLLLDPPVKVCGRSCGVKDFIIAIHSDLSRLCSLTLPTKRRQPADGRATAEDPFAVGVVVGEVV